MSNCFHTVLNDRAVISISGDDARSFLQGIISNDINRVSPDRAIYAAFLTHQGRYLHDFFITQCGEVLLLDCEADRATDFVRRLTMYRLRAKAKIELASETWSVAAVFGTSLPAIPGLKEERGCAVDVQDGVAYVDPRFMAAGVRLMLPRTHAEAILSNLGCEQGSPEAYDRHRLALGLPDGSRDLIVERSILLETGFEELEGISWTKGCYLGQELTANSRRLVIRKRLMPVAVEGPMPEPGTPLLSGERKAGEMRSGRDGVGIALVRVEHLDERDNAVLSAGQTTIRAFRPEWMTIKRIENV